MPPFPSDIVKEITDFPELPNLNYREILPPGLIVLRYGKHKGPHRGFGMVHILEEHEKDLKHQKLKADQQGVIAYVEKILFSSPKIYCEFANLGDDYRPTVVCSKVGTVVLQISSKDQIIYNIVTAYERKNGRGELIGNFFSRRA